MGTLVCFFTTAVLLFSIAACSDDDGEEACAAFAAKCRPGAPGAGPTCDANRINGAANGDDVEDCIEAAADCNAAVACLAALK